MSTFQARSVRVGELRLDDLIHLVGDSPSLTVLAINEQAAPLVVDVAMTKKWGGNGWTSAFACPLCGLPARVLSIRTKQVTQSTTFVSSSSHIPRNNHSNGVACGRCQRRPTLQARNKNRSDWAEARLADTLVRGLLGNRAITPATATARTLRRRSLARASACIDLAAAAIRTADKALKESRE